jgi:AcrR family transcriptional regulator
MGKPSRTGKITTRRRYDSPQRRAQTEKTRAGIVTAGTALAREATTWDWRNLTVRAIAERAGASERTVYRHFASERQLHEAMMRQLEEEAGVTYEGIKLEEIADVGAHVFSSLRSFSVPLSEIHDETFAESDRRRQKSLLEALDGAGVNWPDAERRMAAAVLDALWAPTAYERLVAGWNLKPADATRAMTWVIDLVVQAFREGSRPTQKKAPRRSARKN